MRIWQIVAAVETIIILLLLVIKQRVVVEGPRPVPAFVNPLKEALYYEASDRKFEEVVSQNKYLIDSSRGIEGAWNGPILADCALLDRTNYVRILIANSADVEAAVKSLRDIDANEAIGLIHQVQAEVRSDERGKPAQD